ncbi:MAG: PQQ-dependent sugar dehydrogenase [Desulfuromonadales bacterium]
MMKKGFLVALALAVAGGWVPAGWTHAQESGWPALKLEQVAAGLADPTAIVHAGDGSGRLFILEQPGRIRILRQGELLGAPFLDIADRLVAGGEQGLLGLAFPHGFSEKKYFYVNYTRKPDGATVVSRFRLSADADRADSRSEEVLLTVPQPYGNHNGGQIAFGPDGFLYIGLGDGGGAGDPQENGQDPQTLLGALLRLDVEAGGPSGYAIPPGNPYAGTATGRDEIWAIGLRNPWRFSFDRRTGDLYIADVGQRQWEEIDFQPAASAGGENYGWDILEGLQCYEPARNCKPPNAYTAPVASYDHDLGCSVTGGYVYRGPGNPGMQGLYFFSDYCSGRIWGLRQGAEGWESRVLADTAHAVSTFGEDEAGRLYLADHDGGGIYRIEEDAR